MGVLTIWEDRFRGWRGSPRFEEAWEGFRARHTSLAPFDGPKNLRDFCQDSSVDYGQQDPVIMALCLEARAESEAKAAERFATDLLFWAFVPALWKVVEQAEKSHALDSEEIQAEVVQGFWEEAIKERLSSNGVSGALVNSAKHQVWRTIRGQLKESHHGLEALEEQPEIDRSDPEWADPWLLICYAQLGGEISEIDAELLFWTKFQSERIERVADLLGLSYEVARSRILRAKHDLALWLGQLGDDFPPRDPFVAREVRNLAQKPSNLAHLLGRNASQNGPEMCW